MASKRNEKDGKSKWKTIDSFFTKPVSTETKDSSDEPISQQSLPEFESDNATASCSSVLAVTSRGKANTPPYPDMSSLHDSNLQMTEVKMQLLTSNWNDVNNYDFPAREIGKHSRRLSAKWLLENSWMRYSVSEDALYCGPCVIFGRKEAKEKLFINKVTDWSNLSCFIKRHTREGSPHFQYQAMADNFVHINSKDSADEAIIYKLSEFKKTQVLKNRHVLLKIIETLLLCGKQNIAIRGHTPELSNFMAILNSKAQGDDILRDHLANSSSRAKYTSPDIQNEIINIIGNQIRTSIVENCNNSKFFTLIADETTDTSTREQVSVCLRYLERDTITNKVSIKEDFLDFVMATSTTGEHLAELLIETLISADIITMNMRAQGYDGAANMSGKYKGVQARICEMVPGAMYVHCKSHCLNLAIVHSCKDSSVRNVMSTVQEVAFSFDYSSKKLQAFYQELDSDATTKENMDKRTKLRTLCETRWTSRADALYTFKTSFPVVVHALERLRENGDDKSGQYLASITRFEFVIALVVSEHILQSTVYLSKYLQGVECDLLEATKECRTVIEMLRSERSDEAVWNEIYQTALDLSEPFAIVENMPRRCGRQTTRANHPANTPKQYWKVSLYFPFIDHMIMELESRLISSENRFFAQYLLPRVVENVTNDQITTLFETYEEDLTCNLDEFKREVARWRTRWCITPRDQMPTSLCETLDAVSPVLYPSIDTILSIMLTMPVTSATAERSFSVLRRLKTYVRSTMNNDRLSSLALMHIHRDFNVDIDKVMEKFVSSKTRRADFGQF